MTEPGDAAANPGARTAADAAMISFLAQASLFKGSPPEALAELVQRGRRRGFAPGSALMRQGEVSELIYLITSGRVRVERSQLPTGGEGTEDAAVARAGSDAAGVPSTSVGLSAEAEQGGDLTRARFTEPPLVLAELSSGHVVGELGALAGTPRTATVVAMSETETLELSANDIVEILRHFPEVAVALLRALSEGLRAAQEAADEWRRKQQAITRNLPRR